MKKHVQTRGIRVISKDYHGKNHWSNQTKDFQYVDYIN